MTVTPKMMAELKGRHDHKDPGRDTGTDTQVTPKPKDTVTPRHRPEAWGHAHVYPGWGCPIAGCGKKCVDFQKGLGLQDPVVLLFSPGLLERCRCRAEGDGPWARQPWLSPSILPTSCVP